MLVYKWAYTIYNRNVSLISQTQKPLLEKYSTLSPSVTARATHVFVYIFVR